MQNTDLTEAVLAVFEPISKEVNLVTTNRAIVSADAAEIEEMRRTLDRLAHSVRSVDEGAAAFSNCLIASYESGSPDSFCPGSTPFGPVEEQKRKTSASTSQVNRAPAISKKKRENYPHETTEGLKKWLFDHLHDPYPSDAERDELGARFGLVHSSSTIVSHLSPNPPTEQNTSSQLVCERTSPQCQTNCRPTRTSRKGQDRGGGRRSSIIRRIKHNEYIEFIAIYQTSWRCSARQRCRRGERRR
jgi:hypothetical protein